MTVKGLVVPEVDNDIDGEDVVTYEVIEEFPFAPAVKGIEIVVAFVIDAVPIVGACGIVETVTELEADDAVESPFGLTALIDIVFDEPLVNPDIDNGLVVCDGDKAVYVVPSVEYL